MSRTLRVPLELDGSVAAGAEARGTSWAAEAVRLMRQSLFVPPTPEEVESYCDEAVLGISASRFWDYYAARGWRMADGSQMVDWRAACRLWQSRGEENGWW